MKTIQDLLNQNQGKKPMTLTVYGDPQVATTASTADAGIAYRCRALGAKVTRNIGRDADGKKVNDYGWQIKV